jgi:hypothetical protein
MGRVARVVPGAVMLALSVAIAGCASNASLPNQSTPPVTAHGVTSRQLPPVPAALIADLNRHRGSVLVRRLGPGSTAPVSEHDALVAAREKGANAGKITSASLVTLGLPGSLNTATKAWLFGIAHPRIGPAIGAGQAAPRLRGHPAHTTYPPQHLVGFGADIVNVMTGRWVETATGFAPR